MRGDYRERDDNPAGRVFNILHQASLVKDAPSALDAWVEILLDRKRVTEDGDVSEWSSRDLREIMIRLADAHRLLDEAIEKAQDHDIPIDPFRDHLESLRGAMTPGAIGGKWDQTKRSITPAGLASLAALSQQLSRLDPDGSVPKETLEALLIRVTGLIEEFMKSDDIDDALRVFAVAQLRKIREAVELYHLRGPAALRDALDSITGAAHLTPVEVEKMPEKDRTLLNELKEVIQSLHQAVAMSDKIRKITEALPPIFGYLLGG